DDGHDAQDEEKECEEEADRAGERRPIPEGGEEVPPHGGSVITMKRGDDDDESLEPHADDDAGRDEEERHGAATHPRDPEELRDEGIEYGLGPEGAGVEAEDAFQEHRAFGDIAAVERTPRLPGIGITQHQAAGEHH